MSLIPESTTQAAPLKIEHVTCSRCGGGGQYSYCRSHGTRCFKCGGKGDVFSKRGAIANAYLIRLRSKQVRDLKVGELVRLECDYNLVTGNGVLRFLPITGINADTGVRSWDKETNDWGQVPNTVAVETDKVSTVRHLDDWLRVAQTAEQKLETLKVAVALQNTLTKAGKATKNTPALLNGFALPA